MAYKDAKDNKHNASMAKMMGKVRNPLNSPAQQRPVGKTKEDIGDRTRTIKTKKSGKTIVKDKFHSKKDAKSGDILKERSVHRADGSSKRKRKYKDLGTQKLKFEPTNDED